MSTCRYLDWGVPPKSVPEPRPVSKHSVEEICRLDGVTVASTLLPGFVNALHATRAADPAYTNWLSMLFRDVTELVYAVSFDPRDQYVRRQCIGAYKPGLATGDPDSLVQRCVLIEARDSGIIERMFDNETDAAFCTAFWRHILATNAEDVEYLLAMAMRDPQLRARSFGETARTLEDAEMTRQFAHGAHPDIARLAERGPFEVPPCPARSAVAKRLYADIMDANAPRALNVSFYEETRPYDTENNAWVPDTFVCDLESYPHATENRHRFALTITVNGDIVFRAGRNEMLEPHALCVGDLFSAEFVPLFNCATPMADAAAWIDAIMRFLTSCTRIHAVIGANTDTWRTLLLRELASLGIAWPVANIE